MTTGRTLDREAAPRHALEVSCSDGRLAGTARVLVRVLDVNDHAPAFPQRFYELRVPAAPAPAPPGAAPPADRPAPDSAEWDSDDEDDGSGARPAWDDWAGDEPGGVYVATVSRRRSRHRSLTYRLSRLETAAVPRATRTDESCRLKSEYILLKFKFDRSSPIRIRRRFGRKSFDPGPRLTRRPFPRAYRAGAARVERA